MKKRLLVIAVLLMAAFVCITVLNGMDTELSPKEPSGSGTAATDTADIKPSSKGSPYKFYFERLTPVEKRAYNAIIEKIYDMPERIAVPKIDGKELDNVFSALLFDNPDLFFLGRKCAVETRMWLTYFSVDYIIDKADLADMKAQLERECEAFEQTLTDPGNQWRTELEIHDHVIDRCEYHDPEGDLIYSSSYGALVNGRAACEGYSKAVKLLLDRAGIENALISGVSENGEGSGGAHMWNIVNIGGDYYHLDCTWDDPVSDDGGKLRMYTYFNLSDEMISGTHRDFSYDFGCNSTAENYYIKTGTYFESYSRSSESRLTDIITKSVKNGRYQIQLRFADKKSYDGAVADLIKGERIYEVLTDAAKRVDTPISAESIGYYENPAQKVLTLVIREK